MDRRREYTVPNRTYKERIPEVDNNLRYYLNKEIKKLSDAEPEEVITKVEEMARENIESPRDALFAALSEILKENTGYFVDRILKYQTRVCRDSPNCKRLGCYFKHEERAEGEAMMEVEERGMPTHDRQNGTQKLILDKQRRLIEILSQRTDLPVEVIGIIDQLKKITARIKLGYSGRIERPNPPLVSFAIRNAKPWMTKEHLMTYPGVVNVKETGIVQCRTRKDAETIIELLSKMDCTIETTWT